jgi:uncharacterized membrane protein
MSGLTTLGIFHTAIALVALFSGFGALFRYKEISPDNGLGLVYLVTTFVSAATGLGIFQHGAFGPPHILSIMTLVALAIGLIASKTAVFGGASRIVQAVSFTSTFLFHMIPGFTESLTRLPAGAPLLPSAEAPEFRIIYGALFLIFGAGLFLQLRWLRRQRTARLHAQ